MSELIEVLRPVLRRVRTDDHWRVREGGSPKRVSRKITDAVVRKHLNGGPAIGACPIQRGSDTTMLALIDLDDHDGSAGDAVITGAAQQITDALARRGMRAVPWRSRGGSGVHLYLLWCEPQRAVDVRYAARAALTDAGYAEGTRGVQAGEVELFPKQDRVPEDGHGSMFVLPMAGQSHPLDPDLEWSPMPPEEVQWTASDPVPESPEGEAPVDTSGRAVAPATTLDVLRDALEWVPNDPATDRGYDSWRDVIFAIHHTDPGPDGLETAQEWSARNPAKHDPAFLAGRVWRYVRSDRADAVTARSVLAEAREHGWREPEWAVAQDFEWPAQAEGDEPEEGPPFPALDRADDGSIKARLGNLVAMLRASEHTTVQLAHDEFSDSVMLAPHGRREWRPVRDDDLVRLRMRLEAQGFRPISRELMRDAVLLVTRENRFDAAVEWLTEQVPEWDGTERVETFLSAYYGVEDRAYTRAVSRYWWTAMAGRVLAPGCKADMVPIIHGAQGVGKSEGLKAIVPDESFIFEVSLRADDDALARQMRGKLLGELDELRGLRSRDIEHMKSFCSRRYEEWVPKYQEFTTSFPRRCVFVGTTNAQEFLMDETGHRRFLPLVSDRVDVEGVRRDREQLWAEARELWRRNGVEYAAAERLAAGEHEAFIIEDPWMQAIERWLSEPEDFDGSERPRGERPFTTPEVIAGALGLSSGSVNNATATRVGAVLRRLGYHKARVRVDGAKVMRWLRKDE